MKRIKLLINRKLCILVLGFIIGTGGLLLMPSNLADAENVDMATYEKELNNNQVPIPVKPQYNLKLEEKHQNLTWNLCQNNDLAYEMVLAVFYKESNGFNLNAINKNKNNTRDRGVAQINSNFENFYRDCAVEYCDLPKDTKFNPFDPDHSIRAGIGGLAYLRDYYKEHEEGISDEELFDMTVGAYHMGRDGYRKYIERNGTTETPYSKEILELKSKLEMSGTFE